MKLIAGVAALAAISVAQAQVTNTGLTVRAGLLWPMNEYGRDVGRIWFGLGADYKLMDLPNAPVDALPSYLSISADWYGKGEASVIPILLNLTGQTREGWHYSAGIGFSFSHDEADTVTGTGGGGTGTVAPPGTGGGGGTITRVRRSGTNFAFSLAVGYTWRNQVNPFFVEARFFGHTRSQLNALGIYAGVRF